MSAPTKIIGGREFAFGMMPADVATEVEVTIAGVATEAIAKMLGASGKDADAQAVAMAEAAGTLAKAIGNLGPGKTVEMMNTLFRYCSVRPVEGGKGAPVDLVRDFAGRPKEKWLVFWEALKVNLGDFFPAGLSLSTAPAADPS